MAMFLGLVIGGVVGWFARDAVTLVRSAVASRRRSEPGAKASPDPAPVAEVAPVIHTVKSEEGWVVRQEGADEPLASFPTKAEAQSAGRDLAKQEGTGHVIHRVDDTVGEQHDYSAGTGRSSD